MGIEWEWPNGHVETDVVGVMEGELVLGEAKSSDKVESAQCKQYELLARSVQARRLVFATSQKRWAPGMKERFSTVRNRLRGTHVEAYVDLLADDGPIPAFTDHL